VNTKLTKEEQEVIMDPNPVWECEPPQRETFDDDAGYTKDLIAYARRVIAYRKSTPTRHALK